MIEFVALAFCCFLLCSMSRNYDEICFFFFFFFCFFLFLAILCFFFFFFFCFLLFYDVMRNSDEICFSISLQK